MIYLIDDKKLRQEKDLGWSREKLAKFHDIISPIYSLDELEEGSKKIFQDENTVLYHESFLDYSILNEKSAIKRNRLEQFAQNHPSFLLVIFSGSKNSRIIKKNIAHLPVSIVYQNLQLFLERYKENERKLEYLVFGDNPKIESELLEKLDLSLSNIEQAPAVIENQSCLFIPTFDRYISHPIKDATLVEFFDQESDFEIYDFIAKNLHQTKYDNIFIPLCYGNSLSDFNGLRLATYIRCTSNPNQLSRLFIYGFVKMENLIHNEYFNILRTKNVSLIPFSKQSFQEFGKTPQYPLTIEELPDEIAQLKLDVPKNYEDNHSITNEWAIYSWVKCLGIDTNEEIKIISDIINSNLYFKYLNTIHPVLPSDVINKKELVIKKSGNPKILFIDDEADKGWNELFAYIITDINGIYSDYLGDGFKNQSSEEIITESINKIKNDDIDIIILDFRLNSDDFERKMSEEITSVKLLKEIKKLNPGIQVIVFSVTNKIWNLQILEEIGTYNFILKGDPINTNKNFTKSSIINLTRSIEECIGLGFLKDFYIDQIEVTKELISRRKPNHVCPLPKEFVDEALRWLSLSNDVFNNGGLNEAKIVSSFMFKFSVLENISNRIIDIDNPIEIGKNDKGINKYKFQFRLSDKRLRSFIDDEKNKGFYRKTNKVFESSRNLPWVIKILNTIDFITEERLSEEQLTQAVKKRNDFIHANSTTGDKSVITIEDLIFLNKLIIMGLNNIV